MDVIASSATNDFHVNRLPELEATGSDRGHVSTHFQIIAKFKVATVQTTK
jgi:hypothetical protein